MTAMRLEPTKSKRRAPAIAERPPRHRRPMGSLGETVGSTHPSGLGLWAMGRWTADDEARTRSALERAARARRPMARHRRGVRQRAARSASSATRSLRAALRRRCLFVTTKVSWEHLRPAQVRASLTSTPPPARAPLASHVYLVHAPDPQRARSPRPWGRSRPSGRRGRSGRSASATSPSSSSRPPRRRSRRPGSRQPGPRTTSSSAPTATPSSITAGRDGIVVEAYTPLSRGLLAGRFLDSESLPAEVRRFSRLLPDETAVSEIVGRAKADPDAGARVGRPDGLDRAALAATPRGSGPSSARAARSRSTQVLEACGRVPSDRVLDEADRIARGPVGMLKLVAFDMDGTLVDVAEQLGGGPRLLRRLEHGGSQGVHGEPHRRRGVRPQATCEIWWRHRPQLSRKDLEEILGLVPLMPGARRLLDGLHARGSERRSSAAASTCSPSGSRASSASAASWRTASRSTGRPPHRRGDHPRPDLGEGGGPRPPPGGARGRPGRDRAPSATRRSTSASSDAVEGRGGLPARRRDGPSGRRRSSSERDLERVLPHLLEAMDEPAVGPAGPRPRTKLS